MDYRKHYDLLMYKAKNRLLESDQYRERHHIIPRCLGGSDEPDNLVELTPEEHYVAHQLLVKMYPNNSKLVHAARLMTYDSNGKRINNRLYGWLKVRLSEAVSKDQQKRWQDEKYRKNITNHLRKNAEGLWNCPKYRKRMSDVNKERWKCPEFRKRRSKANKKYWANSENRKKQSEKLTGKANGSYGTHWYHHPNTLDNIRCKSEDKPDGYIKGKRLKPYVKCKVCTNNIENKESEYCETHRPNSHSNKKSDTVNKYVNYYGIFLGSDCTSIAEFIKKYNIDVTVATLSKQWIENVPEYTPKMGRPRKHDSRLKA